MEQKISGRDSFKLRFLSLGGIIGVTKNMYVYELYKNDVLEDILIVDCGIGFPQEKELGVDFVIPDISYLKDKIEKIRGIVLTHGHEDHITALPYHYHDLGSPQVYASKLTSAFVQNKFSEFSQKVNMNVIQHEKEYSMGAFKIRFIHMTHSIPDIVHVLIKTPVGNLYHGPDFKLDLTPPFGKPPDFYEIVKAGKDGLLCLFSDCLGSEHPGLTLSESIVGETFENEMRKTKGKFFMTTFSSNISRIRQCVDAAVKFNRKIVFLGRSMKENTRIAQEIGYLPIPQNFILKEEEVMKIPPNKVCLVVAGSQGQYDSALSKIAHKRNKNIAIKQGDKVIISSDPIPGNENEVYSLIEELTLQGADVIYTDIQDQLHASGHGNQEDLKFLIRFTNPKYFIPIGGTIRHQRQYQRLVTELGYPKDKVFMIDEGDSVWFSKNQAQKGDSIETKNIYVDAFGVGDVGNVVLRDRKTLSSEGIVVAVLTVDNTARLLSRPKIISKGFIFEKDEPELFEDAVIQIERALKPGRDNTIDTGGLKKQVIKVLEEFFLQKKGRRPLVIAEILIG